MLELLKSSPRYSSLSVAERACLMEVTSVADPNAAYRCYLVFGLFEAGPGSSESINR